MSSKTKILDFFRRAFRNPTFENAIRSMIRSGAFRGLGTRLAPNYTLYKPGTMRSFQRNGGRFQVDISDYIGHCSYFGFSDPGYEELLLLAQGKQTVFDIGANIGFTAVTMSKCLSTNGAVYAFEPDPFNFGRLSKNLELNPDAVVCPQKQGLGNEKTELKLAVVTPHNLGGNRIVQDAVSDFTIVPIATLDGFCAEHAVARVDLIKIDVEGFELNVLRGGTAVIARDLPDMFIEINDDNLAQQGHSAREVLELLESLYATLYDAETKKPVSATDDFTKCHFDLVAKK